MHKSLSLTTRKHESDKLYKGNEKLIPTAIAKPALNSGGANNGSTGERSPSVSPATQKRPQTA